MVTTEQDRCSYVLKEGSGIAGYLTVHRSGKDFFVIDEVAVWRCSTRPTTLRILDVAEGIVRIRDGPGPRGIAIDVRIFFACRFG